MGAVGEVLKKEIEVTGEDLEEQIENLIEDIETMIKVEEETDTEAVEVTEEVPRKEEAKPKEKAQSRVKEDKASEKEPTGAIITVKDLAREFGVASKTLRKWLRKNFAKPGGRWEWFEGSSDLENIRRAWKEQNGGGEEDEE